VLLERRLVENPGVEHQQLDRPEILLDGREGGVDAFLRGDIDLDAEDAVELRPSEVARRCPRPEPAKGLGDTAADPAGAAGDERDPPFDAFELQLRPPDPCVPMAVVCVAWRRTASQSSGMPCPGSSESTSSPATTGCVRVIRTSTGFAPEA
jgi:hypothetical protein